MLNSHEIPEVEPLDPVHCIACGSGPEADDDIEIPEAVQDAAGLPWCEGHQFRGDFVNWGAAHGWREAHCGTYAVAQGKDMYLLIATMGDEDMLWHLRSYQEVLSADDTRDMEGAA